MSCPWANVEKPHPVNLQDIISEAIREKKCHGDVKKGSEGLLKDEQLARTLQEHDLELEGSQSVDYDSEEDMDALERKAWEEFDALDREEALMPSCNSLVQDEKVSKFKEIIGEIRDAGKTVLFTPTYQTSPNDYNFKHFYKVFDSSVTYSSDGIHKNQKFEDKPNDYNFGLDGYTCNLLYRLICTKTIKKVNGIIGAGKESIVLHADAKQNFPEKYAIKVFRNDVKGFSEKIEKSSARTSALREMRNLVKLSEAGIPCPRVVVVKKHLLVMSFIGHSFRPAPSLKEMSGDFDKAYNQVINILKTMYREANLIYTELTEEYILWYKNQCYLIDVSQAVDVSHEDAFHFLFWGCSNLIKFFLKKDVDTMSPEELFEFITGIEHGQKLTQLEEQKKRNIC